MRHELKHRISYEDYLVIRSRLKYIAGPDEHVGAGGKYRVHSLYFDNFEDRALREKIDGVDRREKFRIRYYNEDSSCIRLEKKIKVNGLCDKYSAALSKEQAEGVCRGDCGFLKEGGGALFLEFYGKLTYQLLRPKVIVCYEREPYVYGPGNVRITFDMDIRTGLYANRLFGGPPIMVPVPDETILLELKYDAFLPEVIAKAVRVPNRQAAAFSKYAASRMYH